MVFFHYQNQYFHWNCFNFHMSIPTVECICSCQNLRRSFPLSQFDLCGSHLKVLYYSAFGRNLLFQKMNIVLRNSYSFQAKSKYPSFIATMSFVCKELIPIHSNSEKHQSLLYTQDLIIFCYESLFDSNRI